MLQFHKIFFLLGALKVTHGQKVMQDAFIYASQNQEGIRISYSEQPDWSDLNTVLGQHGFMDVGSVCVYGPWIAYQNPNYDAQSVKDYLIVSGANRCVHPGPVKSMQPLGSAETPYSGSITFFTQKYFGIQGVSTNSRKGRKFFETLNGAVNSMVVVGRSQWTITDTKNKSYCFATNFDPRERLPVCVVPDIAATVVGKPLEIAYIHKGCLKTTKPENLISLEDCQYFGDKRPDPNEKDAYKPKVLTQALTRPDDDVEMDITETHRGSKGTPYVSPLAGKSCSGGKPNKAAEEFIMLLEIRLKHNFASQTQLLWPTVDKDVWKTEILDQTWDIAMLIVPDAIVQAEYMQMIREFMVYHLSLYWKGSPKEEPLPDQFLRMIQYDLRQCLNLLVPSADAFLAANTQSWMAGGEKVIFTQFKRKPTLDIVIDTTWLLGNMVMAVCHHVFDYTNNFWANFIHTFNSMYLLPLVDDWQDIRVEDQFILGGYDYESQYQRLAVFATNALQAVPNLEPFDRPEALRNVESMKSLPVSPFPLPKPPKKGRSMEAKFLAKKRHFNSGR